MDEFIAWLEDQPRYDGRIKSHNHEPSQSAVFEELSLHPRVNKSLESQGISQLYQHQARTIQSIREGQNTVTATSTASGKSLTYIIPAIERALQHGTRSLYIAPTRALINDQERMFDEFITNLGFGPRVEARQYTGRQSQSTKRKIREAEPQIILSTPDMLHMALLPHSYRLWEWLFRTLDFVILDEIHEYRGIFGSHVSLTLRRLQRICDRYDSSPQYICSSATIANPTEHASRVTGQSEASFTLQTEDTSSKGPTHWLFWNPPLKTSSEATQNAILNTEGGGRRSPHHETARLFCDLVQQGHQTLVFTNSRQIAERYANRSAEMLTERGESELANQISAYQAALQTERRREIEERLKTGQIRGVWSTNALELGVDIGGLDAVLLDTYPGTKMETLQRAGRAGRGLDSSLVIIVGGQDQLDQYLMANPGDFFEKSTEEAVVNPHNSELLPSHIRCAAKENWLNPDDDTILGPEFPTVVTELESEGEIERVDTRNGIRWTYEGESDPHLNLSLRSIDDREINLIDIDRDETIATLSFQDALRDVHPDAIYYHQGRTYEVKSLQLSQRRALLKETAATHYTSALSDKSISVEEDLESQILEDWNDLQIQFADITVKEQIDGYMRYEGPDDEGTRVEFPEPLPETTIRTKSFYFTISTALERAIKQKSSQPQGFPGAIHGVEHGIISLFPLELLCDRRDIGGLSTPYHPHTQSSTIFVHDGYPGGVGLCRRGYQSINSLLERTRAMIVACDCQTGCPACIQSPHCGNANSPLSKSLAMTLLNRLQ